MTAALFAAKAGAQVTLLDSNAVVGRKLLVTGSGRANLTNRGVSAERYACSDSAWMSTLLAKFGHEDLLGFLKEIGVLTTSTADGWFYPVSDSAQTVASAFDAALRRVGVDVRLGCHISSIRKSSAGFTLKIDSQPDLTCGKLVVAAGGKAYPALGSKGDLFPALKAFGHTVLPLVPALAPVTCEMKEYRALQGVRLDAHISLIDVRNSKTQNDAKSVGAIHTNFVSPNGFGERDELPLHKYLKERANAIRPYETIAETTGNIIFTEWGINGPGVMDLSHHIARHPETHFELRLNFIAGHEDAVRTLIQQHRHEDIPLAVIPSGVLPPKLSAFLITKAGLHKDALLSKTSEAQLDELLVLITSLPLKVTGVRGFEYCQISAGGVPVSEVDPATMQSRVVPGLYLIGETLDVVGPCGGYNLQFAFSTGAVAGRSIGEEKPVS